MKYCIGCNKLMKDKRRLRCRKCYYEFSKGKLNCNYGKPPKHGKKVYYKKIFMRSSYEFIYAQWLDYNNIKWIYEPRVFDLGNTTYTPDFYLPEKKRYIEVKGWWRDNAKKKFKKFKKKYPNIKISLIIRQEIERITKSLEKGGIKL